MKLLNNTRTKIVTFFIISLIIISVSLSIFLFIDYNNDGMNNYENIQHGTDIFSSDTTGDGLTDYEEIFEYGTDPTTTDTTGDGLSDYDEVHEYGTDPTTTDTTGDGLSDYDEIHKYGTDPSTEDTTGDGLSDYDEIYEYGTDPTTTDTNNDGLSDAKNIEHGADPLSSDTTGDGLSDYDEVRVYGTDPTTTDTSGDGLSDYDEVHEYGTDPTTTDTTGDGLTDYEEIYEYGTDPTTTDTTGDGLSDYNEVHEYGTDPTTTDTTEDGLTDYEEINEYGTDPTTTDTTGDELSDYKQIHSEYDYKPTVDDTNDDGVPDVVNYEYGAIPTTQYTVDKVEGSGDSLFSSDLYQDRPSLLNDTELYTEFGVLLSEDYNIFENQEIADRFDFIHTEKPVDSSDEQPRTFNDDTNDGFSNELIEQNNNLTNDKKNILIHVEANDDEELPVSALINTHLAFLNSPVEYDHSDETGINIQFYVSDNTANIESNTEGISTNDVLDNADSIYTNGYGYHYMLLKENVQNRNGFVVYYIGEEKYEGGVTKTDRDTPKEMGSTFMHEIGHMVSLYEFEVERAFDGIDSHEYSFEEYPSVMNYNYNCDGFNLDQCYTFSDSGEFNDWEHIQENYIDFVPNRDEL